LINVPVFNEFMRDLERKDEFSGVVLLKQCEEVLFSGAYGYACRGWKVKNSLEMRFATASITKMFTAVSVLQLIDSRKMVFEDRVVDLLQLQDTSVPQDVSVYQLLTHTSGIGDYFDETESDTADDYEKVWAEVPCYGVRNLSDFLPLIVSQPPRFQAGREFSYSDAGYILLGLIVERESGMNYRDYVQENVFDKAGMTGSGFFAADGVEGEVAEGYLAVKDSEGQVTGWRKNLFSVPPVGASDGGAFTTAHDLVRFMRVLRNRELLSYDMTGEMFVPRVHMADDEGITWQYCYGLYCLSVDDRVLAYGHGGSDPGVSTSVYYYPNAGVDAVVLGNQSECGAAVTRKIREMMTI
jgi:CubicO group peptidase (beta-lactamase class C family)